MAPPRTPRLNYALAKDFSPRGAWHGGCSMASGLHALPEVHMKASRAVVVCGLATFLAGGCATKKYVSREVGSVSEKTDALSSQLEGTQERVQRSEVKIDEVDRQAQSGISDARRAAGDAMSKATDAEKAAKGKII